MTSSEVTPASTVVDWDGWRPRDISTLVFVLRGAEVLLIRKRRGLGAGKINGPGGRLEPGETLLQCAVREVEEELRITPLELSHRGRLRFQFLDGYSMLMHVYVAMSFRGCPETTAEAIPQWTPLDALPFEQMWADDVHWLPRVLRGESVEGRFVFDGDVLLAGELF